MDDYIFNFYSFVIFISSKAPPPEKIKNKRRNQSKPPQPPKPQKNIDNNQQKEEEEEGKKTHRRLKMKNEMSDSSSSSSSLLLSNLAHNLSFHDDHHRFLQHIASSDNKEDVLVYHDVDKDFFSQPSPIPSHNNNDDDVQLPNMMKRGFGN